MTLKPADGPTADPSGPFRESVGRLYRLVASIRIGEVLVLLGTPLFGALFAVGRITQDKAASLALLLASSFCLLAHVFVFNDWAGADGDLRDPYRAPSVFLNRGVRRSDVAYLAAALMALGLLLLIPLGGTPLAVGAGIVVLSALYSAPGLHFKGIPLAGSALHLIGAMLHFLLGYSAFHAIDARGLAIGGFFALTFAAGHLTHEVRDWEGDRANGIETNAVRFGRKAAFAASITLFTAAYVLLIALAARDIVPYAIVWIATVYPLQLYWTIQTLRRGLSFESVSMMRVRYRLVFMAIGAIMVVALFPSFGLWT